MAEIAVIEQAAPAVEPSNQQAAQPETPSTLPEAPSTQPEAVEATESSEKPETTDVAEEKTAAPAAASTEGEQLAEILGESQKSTDLDDLIKRIAATKKVAAEESDISDSEDDDELIANVEDWDITFKLTPYLDNHFILPLLNHLKDQKRVLGQNSSVAGDDAKDEKRDDDDGDENKENKKPANEASLVAEQLFSLFDDATLNNVEFELLSKTCLIDEQLDLVETLKHSQADDRTRGLTDYKQKVLAKLQQLEEVCGPLIDFLGDEKAVNDLMREKAFNLNTIQEKQPTFDAAAFNIDDLYAYCRLRYEVGFYHDTDVLLGYYRMLTPDLQKKNIVLWGQLSAQILQNKWDDAFRVIREIRENIDDNLRTLNLGKGEEAAEEDKEDYLSKRLKELEAAERGEDDDEEDEDDDDEDDAAKEALKTTAAVAAVGSGDYKTASVQIASIMRDRAWLLHWSLFLFFNKDTLLDEMTNFFDPKYMNVIQTMCPHLLRYLTAAILISPTFDKGTKLKYLTDVSKIIIEEQSRFTDPITEFVRLVIRTNDFDGASTMLRYAIQVIKCDFFLAYYHDYFVQFARTTFLIKYCRLHSRVCVPKISALLLMDGMTIDEQQLWLINAIRSESISAKLDVVENVIYVTFGEANPYQEMKDRIKGMNHRTVQLYKQIKHKEEQLNSKNEV